MTDLASPPRTSSRRSPVRLRDGITYKQAATTLAIALILTLAGGAFELFLDWRSMRDEVRQQTQQSLELVRGSAVEAAYQLHPELARRLVDGLFAIDAVEQVVLKDNFGRILGERRRETVLRTGQLAARLFGDMVHHPLPLEYAGDELVGQLEVTLSAEAIAQRFYERAGRVVAVGSARAVAIAALVVLIFYVMITRPLLRINAAIGRADPLCPGTWPRPRLQHHARDELGQLVDSLDDLLQAFQHGLIQRDAAEAELKALTQELELRVDARTQELRVALEALALEKAETERAFHELGETHAQLARANRMVVESIQYARRIQSAMLPDKAALGDAVRDIYVCWEPLHVVGGDYFWLERFGEKSILLVADCTGHGVPGAFITLVVASTLDRILHEQKLLTPSEILGALDEMVRRRLRQDREDSDSDDGLEAAICLWDHSAGTLTFAGAGLPLIYTDGADAHEIRGSRAILGYRTRPDNQAFADHVIEVRPGMSFYLLTDGAPDHMGGEPRRLLGRRRLRRVIATHMHEPMVAQMAHIQHFLEAYRGDEPRRDDMTLVGFTPL